MEQSIFISKNSTELPLLSEFCVSHQFTLYSHSLVSFKGLSFEIFESYEVVFFSSIRAAEYFLTQETLPDHCQIACVGAVTAKKINALGFGVSFIGEQAGNPMHVAEMFKIWLGDRRVLFPLSSESKRTIVDRIAQNQRIEVVVYATTLSPLKIKKCDWLVFTSPSNVEGYFLLNTPQEAKIIAWGSTTEKVLKEKGYSVEYTLSEANEENLVAFLNKKSVL